MIKKILVACTGALISYAYYGLQIFPDGKLHVAFLDIGQGDSTFIQTPSGVTLLIDGGPGNSIIKRLQEQLPFFKKSLDYVILTHPDRDHAEGLVAVLKKYKTKRLLLSGIRPESGLSGRLIDAARQRGTKIEFADAASDLHFGDGVTLDFLFPKKQTIFTPIASNATSLVARLTLGPHSVLLTGDITQDEETALLRQRVPVDSDILKVAHHGSKTSSSAAFLRAVSPEICAISVGANNSYHHPHPSALARLNAECGRIFRTDRDGTVEITFSSSNRSISAPNKRSFSSNRS